MRYQTDTLAPSRFFPCSQETLYHVQFFGGPFDGHLVYSDMLPERLLNLASGPADCGTRIGSVTVRRLARYRWTATHWKHVDGLPVIEIDYEYRGTVNIDLSRKPPLWRRGVAALRRCWSIVELPARLIARNAAQRKVAHVQS